MGFLVERLVLEFTEELSGRGWRVAFVEDDELIVFDRRLSGGILAELGLDLTPRDYGLSLNPSVSVRHEVVSELYEELSGLGGDEGTVAQVGRSLSGLVREGGECTGGTWTVERVEEVPVAVQAVLEDLERYGEPFFAQHRSLDAIIASMGRMARSNLDHAHLAVAAMIADRQVELSSALLNLEELADTDPPLLAAHTRQFLSAFRARTSS